MAKESKKERRLKEYQQMKVIREGAMSDARLVNKFLLPSRGVFNESKPQRRKTNSTAIVDPTAREALKVLTAGFQGGLTPPSRPWFQLNFVDQMLQKHPILSSWLYDCQQRMYAELSASNFYQAMHTFYTELLGFGTGSLYVGEDSEEVAFRFENLTFGEYCIATNSRGLIDRLYRVMSMNESQLVDAFGDRVPPAIRTQAENSGYTANWYTIMECVVPERYQDKKFRQEFYLIGGTLGNGQVNPVAAQVGDEDKPLLERGFYEFPYPTARVDVVAGDDYGIGFGIEAVPSIKRLQEMVKAFNMAAHKAIEPPLNIPAGMRGKISSLPGGENYYRDPREVITPLYNVNFDYKGVSMSIDSLRMFLKTLFLNDVFLTASRDPNASPLKATEVNVKESEKMIRLGPVIERTHYECLQSIIERCFNIMVRKGKFATLPPELAMLVGDYEIRLVSVLAQAQKAMAAQPIESMLQFVGAIGSFDQQALDLVDADEAIRQYADITGTPNPIIRPEEEVQMIRQRRAAAQKAQARAQAQAQNAAMQSQVEGQRATTIKTLSDAGVNVASALETSPGVQQ